MHECPRGRHRSPHWLCYANCPCRCDGCRKAHVKQRHLRELGHRRLVDGATTRAKLRWLHDDQGLTDERIAAMGDVSRRTVSRLRTAEPPTRVRRGTAEAVERVYRGVLDARVEPLTRLSSTGGQQVVVVREHRAGTYG